MTNSSIISRMGIAGRVLVDRFAVAISDHRRSLPVDQIDVDGIEALNAFHLLTIDARPGEGKHRTVSLTDKGVSLVAWYASQTHSIL